MPQHKPKELTLPLVLAGPIVRRAETTAIYIWVCLSEKLDLGARIYAGRADASTIVPNQTYRRHRQGLEPPDPIGWPNVRQIGEGKSTAPVQLGARLYCH
jgi:hypothetical protein